MATPSRRSQSACMQALSCRPPWGKGASVQGKSLAIPERRKTPSRQHARAARGAIERRLDTARVTVSARARRGRRADSRHRPAAVESIGERRLGKLLELVYTYP